MKIIANGIGDSIGNSFCQCILSHVCIGIIHQNVTVGLYFTDGLGDRTADKTQSDESIRITFHECSLLYTGICRLFLSIVSHFNVLKSIETVRTLY